MYEEIITGGQRRRWVGHLLTGSAAEEQTFLTRVLSVLSMVDTRQPLAAGASNEAVPLSRQKTSQSISIKVS